MEEERTMNPYIAAIGFVMVLGVGIHIGGFLRTGEYGLLAFGALLAVVGGIAFWLARVVHKEEDGR